MYLHITVCTGAGKSLLTQWDPGAAAPGRESLHKRGQGTLVTRPDLPAITSPGATLHGPVQNTPRGQSSDPRVQKHMYVVLNFFFIIYLFLEGKGGRKEEKHQCVVPSHATPTRDLALSPGMCLDGELTINPLVHRRALNPMSHTSEGSCMSLKCITFMIELL